MLVLFNDGVRMWVHNRNNVTYADDEPIKTWKIPKGTEVAAKYTDGFVYDAVVLRAHYPNCEKDEGKNV